MRYNEKNKVTHFNPNEINIVLDSLLISENYYKQEQTKLSDHLINTTCETLRRSINDSISYSEGMEKETFKLRESISFELGISINTDIDSKRLEQTI